MFHIFCPLIMMMNCNIFLYFSVFYLFFLVNRVSNATVSIANVENAHHSTRLLAQTTLRNTMGTRHLHEILSERMTISGSMQVSHIL